MREIKDGGPAFPFTIPTNFQAAEAGMSLRDWFAGQALMSLCAGGFGNTNFDSDTARMSYELADAMLKAREARDA